MIGYEVCRLCIEGGHHKLFGGSVVQVCSCTVLLHMQAIWTQEKHAWICLSHLGKNTCLSDGKIQDHLKHTQANHGMLMFACFCSFTFHPFSPLHQASATLKRFTKVIGAVDRGLAIAVTGSEGVLGTAWKLRRLVRSKQTRTPTYGLIMAQIMIWYSMQASWSQGRTKTKLVYVFDLAILLRVMLHERFLRSTNNINHKALGHWA